jgi:hypothetical protein
MTSSGRPPLFEARIAGLVRACCAHPVLTLVLVVLVTIGAGAYASRNFAIQTDTGKLISPDLPWRQRELQFDAAFPHQSDALLVVVDGATPELADSAAKSLDAALANKPDQIKAVYDPAGGAFFETNGLLFLSVDEVRQTTEQLIRAQAFLGTLAADPSLRGLAQALGFIPQGVEDGSIAFKDFAKPLSLLAGTIDGLLEGRPASFSWNALMTGEAPKSRELRRLIRVSPVLDFDALEPGAAASETIRKEAAALGLTRDHGVTVRLTGPVAMADEEFATVADGALLNVLLTAVAVLIILWFALRSARVIFAVILSLFAGLVITAALGLAMVGALNLISVAFAVLFVGIGVDFGIQFAVRYRAERHRDNDLHAALGNAAKLIAKPLALAAAAHTGARIDVLGVANTMFGPTVNTAGLLPGSAVLAAARDRGYTFVSHQQEVGTGYFDEVTQAIQGGHSSTTATLTCNAAILMSSGPASVPKRVSSSGSPGKLPKSLTRIIPAAPWFRALIALLTISACVVNCLPANTLFSSFTCGSWRNTTTTLPLASMPL